MAYTNHRLLLAERPEGMPTRDAWRKDAERLEEPGEGELIVEQHYISLDPAMRGWMRNVRSYVPPVELDAVMRAGSVGKVVASKHPDFSVGQTVVGTGGVQEYCLSDGKGWTAVALPDEQMSRAIGVLGMTGLTAYFGLLEVGQPKAGDTVLVSGAAGAVGSVVGQIAKIKGCRVIGIAGGAEKCAFLTDELGFDAAIDYKSESLVRKIRGYCPDGVDVYFDNVGGETLDAALANLAMHARIVICGAISQYNATEKPVGPSNYMSLLVYRARMQGFLVFDYARQYKSAINELAGWLQAGQLKDRQEVVAGLDHFYDAFERLFTGEKLGKMVLRVR